jgi:hypothetical protein
MIRKHEVADRPDFVTICANNGPNPAETGRIPGIGRTLPDAMRARIPLLER